MPESAISREFSFLVGNEPWMVREFQNKTSPFQRRHRNIVGMFPHIFLDPHPARLNAAYLPRAARMVRAGHDVEAPSVFLDLSSSAIQAPSRPPANGIEIPPILMRGVVALASKSMLCIRL